MSASDLNVRHLARLARLALTAEEEEVFEGQLCRVLEHIEFLKRLDVADVEPTAHPHAVFNVIREDAPQAGLATEAAMALAPRSANQLFIVPKVVE